MENLIHKYDNKNDILNFYGDLPEFHKYNEKNIDINVFKTSNSINGYETSYIKLLITGIDMNYIITNTLRRVALSCIPIYAFDVNDILIHKNTTIYDNDEMRLRLSQIPLYLSNNIYEKYKMKKLNDISTIKQFKILSYKAKLGSIEKDLFAEITEDKAQNLNIYVSFKNETSSIYNLTTTDKSVKFIYKGIEINENIFEKPVLIIKLNPGEEFIMHATSSLNIGYKNAIFQSCYAVAATYNNDEYFLSLHSKRQLNELDILIRSCKILREQIFVIYKSFKKTIFNETTRLEGTLIIDGEQYTIGNILTYYIQKHKNTLFAGYSVNNVNKENLQNNYNIVDLNKNLLHIQYKVNANINIILDDIINEINDILLTIENKLNILFNENKYGYLS